MSSQSASPVKDALHFVRARLFPGAALKSGSEPRSQLTASAVHHSPSTIHRAGHITCKTERSRSKDQLHEVRPVQIARRVLYPSAQLGIMLVFPSLLASQSRSARK